MSDKIYDRDRTREGVERQSRRIDGALQASVRSEDSDSEIENIHIEQVNRKQEVRS